MRESCRLCPDENETWQARNLVRDPKKALRSASLHGEEVVPKIVGRAFRKRQLCV